MFVGNGIPDETPNRQSTKLKQNDVDDDAIETSATLLRFHILNLCKYLLCVQ